MSTYAMFDQQEAVTFIQDRLDVKNVLDRKETDRKGLLHDITVNMHYYQPFCNVQMLEKDVENRRRPTLEEVKTENNLGIGGMCYNINVVVYFLLKALGFKASLALARCVVPHANHLIVLVRDVEKPDDTFFIDSGIGFPTLRVISLDFEKESPVYTDSFLEYKLAWMEDGQLARLHGKGGKKDSKETNKEYDVFIDGWYLMSLVDTSKTTDNIQDYDDIYDDIFSSPMLTPFIKSFTCRGFFNKRFVIIMNEKLHVENENGELDTFPITGGDEGILAALGKYFPMVPQDRARTAIANWRQDPYKTTETPWD